ncbi:unnamed protein product [Kluyveromyces dobzhanskii CBS 2104]|uniref:3-ketodihydrosphingosine reductase TSC10 n=1 Tax=Kluyveromyces dobzhanskii CBS 2104 TaxID=1427455 RepID=A0A0A8L8S3_9SACH|nr:unnamed protein product [Kluyveromyces dobzhanskii CBS 2104]
MKGFSCSGQVILISGGSQGLGESFAKRFVQGENSGSSDDTNNKVIIVSRSESKLQKACERIGVDGISLEQYVQGKDQNKNGNENGACLVYHSCDISSYTSVEAMFALLRKSELIPTQVYMCAGGSIPKLFVDLTPEELQNGITMNYTTAVNLSHVSLKHNVPHLLFFSSEVAFFPFIGYSQYAPLKQSIRSLVSVLRQEHSDKRITCVYPGNFQSEGYDLENMTKPSITKEIEGPSHPVTAAECRDKIISSINWGLDEITTDSIGWILMACDQGFNKHNTKQFMFIFSWIIGAILNITVVPIYMLICKFQIYQWKKNKNT